MVRIRQFRAPPSSMGEMVGLERGQDGRTVTRRAVVIGLAGSLAIALYTPYNDWILHNTPLIGNHFPLAPMVFLTLLVLLVNPLLARFGPRARLGGGELVTIISMMLVACAFPGSGLHRYWAVTQMAPVYHLPMHPTWQPLVDALPSWMVPTKDPDDQKILYAYYQGVRNRPDLGIPWAAWARQALRWSMLIIPLFLGVMCLTAILRRQWVESEKLQFPLAAVTLEMVRDPEPGRRWNRLFRDRGLWTAVGLVGTIHLLNGLHVYFEKVPAFPLYYDVYPVFAEAGEPWRYMGFFIYRNEIFFWAVGIAFLLTSEVSLSLWACVVFYAVASMFLGWFHVDYGLTFRSQAVGAYMAASAVIVFVARRHFLSALRLAFSWAPAPAGGEYIPPRLAARLMLLCLAACSGWFVAAGLPVWQAICTVLLVYMVFLVVGRIVAETGLMFILNPCHPDFALGSTFGGAVSGKQIAVIATGTLSYSADVRETLMPYALNSVRMADAVRPARPVRFLLALLAAMVVSLFVSGASHIGTITWFGSLNGHDRWGDLFMPRLHFDYAAEVDRGASQPGTGVKHVALGAAIFAGLAIGRLRLSRWPLHPIGYLLMLGVQGFWFSIFLGWACKSLALRLGGVGVYQRLKPVFIGLILGDAMMSGFWLAVSGVLELAGISSRPVPIMPG